MSISRDAVGVCLLGDKLYAVGGYDGQAYLNTVESYDPQINEWTQVMWRLRDLANISEIMGSLGLSELRCFPCRHFITKVGNVISAGREWAEFEHGLLFLLIQVSCFLKKYFC
uniref:Uncharacterized protein n=1 Tax=Pseudonaja textilis TaxID=8673 RepID=A0A670XWJ0_PSETE